MGNVVEIATEKATDRHANHRKGVLTRVAWSKEAGAKHFPRHHAILRPDPAIAKTPHQSVEKENYWVLGIDQPQDQGALHEECEHQGKPGAIAISKDAPVNPAYHRGNAHRRQDPGGGKGGQASIEGKADDVHEGDRMAKTAEDVDEQQ